MQEKKFLWSTWNISNCINLNGLAFLVSNLRWMEMWHGGYDSSLPVPPLE